MERISKSTAGHLKKSLTWHVAFWLNSWIQCVIMAERDLLKLSEKPVIQHIRMIKAALRGRNPTRVPVSERLYNTRVQFVLFAALKDFAKRNSGPPLPNFSQMEKKNVQRIKQSWAKWTNKNHSDIWGDKNALYSYIFILFYFKLPYASEEIGNFQN